MFDLTYPINACDSHLSSISITHGGAPMFAGGVATSIIFQFTTDSSRLSPATASFPCDLHLPSTVSSPLFYKNVADLVVNISHPPSLCRHLVGRPATLGIMLR